MSLTRHGGILRDLEDGAPSPSCPPPQRPNKNKKEKKRLSRVRCRYRFRLYIPPPLHINPQAGQVFPLPPWAERQSLHQLHNHKMASSSTGILKLEALTPLKPKLNQRAWASVPHPTLPLLATCHSKAVTIYSLSTLSSHSSLTGGHARSVRSAAWKPALSPHKLCLVTGSFDATAAVWRWDGENEVPFDEKAPNLEVEITRHNNATNSNDDGNDATEELEWEYTLVLEGHESEVKSVAFSPAGQYLATCSRDKSVWIWEDVGANEADDEWETVAVLTEHDADVKSLAWCPDVPGRTARGKYSADVLASSSYDDTVRIWREDGDGEWVCVAVLEGHEGTVWGVQWEADPARKKFPRLMSFSADRTIRIWMMKQDDGDEEQEGIRSPMFQSGLGGIPNTMRASVREEWECVGVLPAAHTRDVYSATWSASSGLVASTGSDGVIALYGETRARACQEERESTPEWQLLTTIKNAHGPYEINHITWCRRFDAGSEARGTEEMLVTTGDDGVVRPWRLVAS